MKTVAVIAEFNPPHNGHAYLASQIREELGADTRIIAIMSGNYVQRGDMAIVNKYTRSKLALSMGYNLVLELPFPYSSLSARDFGKAGVTIANGLACVDYLAFGCESGTIERLTPIADFIASPLFETEMKEARANEAYKNRSYAQLSTMIQKKHLGNKLANEGTLPNNILALSYLIAIKETKSTIKPYGIKRLGDFHATSLKEGEMPSASAIRLELVQGNLDAVKPFVNETVWQGLNHAYLQGRLPADIEKIYPAIAERLLKAKERTKEKKRPLVLHAECEKALKHRMFSAVTKVNSYSELIDKIKAKHYTDAHLRRAVLFSHFGVGELFIKKPVQYTALLAADNIGRKLLKQIKTSGRIPVLTKTADHHTLPNLHAKVQLQYSTTADMSYMLALPAPLPPANAFTISPYIQNDD